MTPIVDTAGRWVKVISLFKLFSRTLRIGGSGLKGQKVWDNPVFGMHPFGKYPKKIKIKKRSGVVVASIIIIIVILVIIIIVYDVVNIINLFYHFFGYQTIWNLWQTSASYLAIRHNRLVSTAGVVIFSLNLIHLFNPHTRTSKHFFHGFFFSSFFFFFLSCIISRHIAVYLMLIARICKTFFSSSFCFWFWFLPPGLVKRLRYLFFFC